MLKRISPAIFGILLICFFLPWVSVSCQGQKVITLTGIQLVTGISIEESEVFRDLKRFNHPYIRTPSPSSAEKINGEPLAILTFLATIGGLILSLLKSKIGLLGSAIAGGIGIILLYALSSKLINETLKHGLGILQLDYRFGFILTQVLFLLAVAVNIYSIIHFKGEASNSAQKR